MLLPNGFKYRLGEAAIGGLVGGGVGEMDDRLRSKKHKQEYGEHTGRYAGALTGAITLPMHSALKLRDLKKLENKFNIEAKKSFNVFRKNLDAFAHNNDLRGSATKADEVANEFARRRARLRDGTNIKFDLSIANGIIRGARPKVNLGKSFRDTMRGDYKKSRRLDSHILNDLSQNEATRNNINLARNLADKHGPVQANTAADYENKLFGGIRGLINFIKSDVHDISSTYNHVSNRMAMMDSLGGTFKAPGDMSSESTVSLFNKIFGKSSGFKTGDQFIKSDKFQDIIRQARKKGYADYNKSQHKANSKSEFEAIKRDYNNLRQNIDYSSEYVNNFGNRNADRSARFFNSWGKWHGGQGNSNSSGGSGRGGFNNQARSAASDVSFTTMGIDKTKFKTKKEVEKHYRNLARKNHPDLMQDPSAKDAATKRMADINNAYGEIKQSDWFNKLAMLKDYRRY